MAVDDAQAEMVVAHVKRTWKSGCPLCGSMKWEVAGFTNPSLYEHIDLATFGGLSPYTTPLAGVVCMKCGNTVYVNLVVAGIATDGTDG